MRLGTHARELAGSLSDADRCFVYARPDLKWDAASALAGVGTRLHIASELDALITAIVRDAQDGDRVLMMSNGDFDGIHGKLLQRLRAGALAGDRKSTRLNSSHK